MYYQYLNKKYLRKYVYYFFYYVQKLFVSASDCIVMKVDL
jgi:hypothetical protein